MNIGHDRDRRRHTEQKKNHQSLRCAFHCVPPTGKADIEFACHLKWDWSVAHLLPSAAVPIQYVIPQWGTTKHRLGIPNRASAVRKALQLHELLSGGPRSSIPRSADSPRWLRGYACSDSPLGRDAEFGSAPARRPRPTQRARSRELNHEADVARGSVEPTPTSALALVAVPG